MTFSIFRYAALNKLSEYSSESDSDDEVPNIIPGPVDANDVKQIFDSSPKNTEIKNNFKQNGLNQTADNDNDSENKNETTELHDDINTTDTHVEIKGGDQLITYDVSFINSFPFIVATPV